MNSTLPSFVIPSKTAPALIGWALALVGALTLGAQGCQQIGNSTVGDATCLACHDGRLAPDRSDFLESLHRAEEVRCEDCHGEGFQHARIGGRGGLFIDALNDRPVGEAHLICVECHEEPAAAFLRSGHAELEVATCVDCHDVHSASGLTQPEEDNSLCLQCHETLGFPNDFATDFHTAPFHPVDPVGSGASRCSSCHMPQLEQMTPRGGARDHTLFTVPPSFTLEAAAAGVVPVPPNSCAGVMGCHDPAVPGSGPPRDVNDLALVESLIPLYERLGGILAP